MSASFAIGRYIPPGPVARSFITHEDLATGLMGPVGSGKTHATIFKLLRYSALMPPMKDGIIRAKGAVVRTDYRTLYKTTLSSWFSWFPKDYPGSDYTGGADRPATHIVRFITPRGRKMEITVEFTALGENRIEDVMRGWEGSWAWMNEADLLAEDALSFLLQRTSRWPSKKSLEHDADIEPRVFLDLNPPDNPNHWLVKRFLGEKKAEGHMLFRQPSGLSPQAENIANLPKNYYQNFMKGMDDWNITRFVHGKIGYDRSGFPVYPDFDERENIAPQPLEPIPGVPILLGFDLSGLHPGAVVLQRAPDLQLRALHEFYFGRVGPARFIEMMKAVLDDRFRDCPVSRGIYDPSNDYGADKEGGMQSSIDIAREMLNIPMMSAWSNENSPRIEAVRSQLILPIRPGVRGMVVCPKYCPMLIEGFMSLYHYKKNTDGTVQNAEHPRPHKNEHANLHDALQYITMDVVGRAGMLASAVRAGGGIGYEERGGRSGNTSLKSDFAV